MSMTADEKTNMKALGILVSLGIAAVVGSLTFAFTVSNDLSTIAESVRNIQISVSDVRKDMARKEDVSYLKEGVRDNKKSIEMLEQMYYSNPYKGLQP